MNLFSRHGIRKPSLAVAAVAVVALIATIGCGGSSSKTTTTSRAPAVAASVGTLRSLESSLRHPIYWAGAKADYTYELTKTTDGNVYVRYLPPGVKVGDARAAFLTVGTYPQTDAFKNVLTASKRKGARKTTLPGGGIAVQNKSRPTSVYIAYPQSSLLVEVFNPSPNSARALVRSGQIKPLG